MLNLLLGKKDIVCCDNTISIKSSFILTKAKEKKYKISDVDCLLLQCEESERSEIRDIFCSHIRMSIIPIYYDVKIEQTGELILRFNDKQTALRFFDYITHEFSENNKKIDFGQEERILNARHRLLLLMSKSFFLFCSITTFFFSLILFFCSYGIYSDYSKNFWKKSNILVENTKSNDHVSVIIQDEAESNSKLVCSVLSSDLIALQNAAKEGKKIAVYISFKKSPALRISPPTREDSVLFFTFAASSASVSGICFCLFWRTRRKFLQDEEIDLRGNTPLYWQ